MKQVAADRRAPPPPPSPPCCSSTRFACARPWRGPQPPLRPTHPNHPRNHQGTSSLPPTAPALSASCAAWWGTSSAPAPSLCGTRCAGGDARPARPRPPRPHARLLVPASRGAPRAAGSWAGTGWLQVPADSKWQTLTADPSPPPQFPASGAAGFAGAAGGPQHPRCQGARPGRGCVAPGASTWGQHLGPAQPSAPPALQTS